MRTLAKVSVALLSVVAVMLWKAPILVFIWWVWCPPLFVPIVWYVLFTLPEERAREFEILRCLATREPTR